MIMPISKTYEDLLVTVFQLNGNILDESSFTENFSYFDNQITNWKNKKIIIDLSQVKTINSTGINFLIRLLTKTRVAGGDLLLFGLQTNVLTVIQLTKLNDVFKIINDIEQAINEHNQTK